MISRKEVFMAVCDYCTQEMLSADGCTDAPIVIDGESYSPIRHGSRWDMPRTKNRCHDCYALPGHVHHHGCDMERCPACGDQSISCGCLWAGEEHVAEDWVEQMEERFELVGPDE
jgi:hypothetical protein